MPQEHAAFFSANTSALEAWFNNVDADRSGAISVAELQKALQKGGLKFSAKLVASLMRVHDSDNSLELEFREFCELHNDLQSIKLAFDAKGGSTSGKLTLPQVQEALKHLQFTLDMQPDGAFYKLVKSYDFEQKSEIDLERFIAMCVQLRNAQKMFNLFDAHQGTSGRTGRITLDWNQYVWSVAQI